MQESEPDPENAEPDPENAAPVVVVLEGQILGLELAIGPWCLDVCSFYMFLFVTFSWF